MAKETGKMNDMTIVRSVGYSIPACLGATLGGMLLIAAMVNAERIAWETTGYCIMAVTVLSTLAGCVLSIKSAGQKAMIVSVATGIVYYLLLLGCNALLFDGQYEGVGETLLLILGTCICTALLTVHKNKGNRRSGKRRNR